MHAFKIISEECRTTLQTHVSSISPELIFSSLNRLHHLFPPGGFPVFILLLITMHHLLRSLREAPRRVLLAKRVGSLEVASAPLLRSTQSESPRPRRKCGVCRKFLAVLPQLPYS